MDVEKGSPAGMIFVGEGNNYLGYLTVGNGIDSLPLHYDENDVESIDLGTLFASESGESMESPNDLFKNKFSLSEEEQRSLRFAGGLFSAIVKNPDANRNGEIDLLEEKFFPLHLTYYYYGGDFLESHKNGLTPKVNDPSGIWNGFQFGIRGGADWPETIYFYGPEGSESVIDHPESQDPIVFDTHTYYSSSYVDNHDYPPKGVYTVDYKIDGVQKTLKFNVPDQSEGSEKTVLPIPTVELNNDGTINKVSWTYKAAKEGALEVDPKAIVDKVELQIAGDGKQCDDYIQGEGRMYNSGNLPGDTTEHVLECQDLFWDKVTGITMGYEDAYGNNNAVGWVPKVNMR